MENVATCFRQSCPVCGRPLNVSTELLGQKACCSHCFGVFVACNREANSQSSCVKTTKKLGHGINAVAEEVVRLNVKLAGQSLSTRDEWFA